MKIAICLSGQPRSIEFAKKSILNHFCSGRGHEYDFFCHSWDYNTWKLQDITFTEPEIVDRTWLAGQFQSMGAKSFQINSLSDYNAVAVRTKNKFVNYGSLLYSMMIANHLKRQYEIENDFVYDAVVKARFDSVFHPVSTPLFQSWTKMPNQKVFFPHASRMPLEYNRTNASDCVFLGDSWGMDIACDLFRYVANVDNGCKREDDYECLGPGTLMSYYLRNKNVEVAEAPIGEYFYRKEVMGLDAVNDFDAINKLHASFYAAKNW